MTFKLNIVGQVQRLERLDAQAEQAYWRGVNRRTIRLSNEGDLDHVPLKGSRNFGTSQPMVWDFTTPQGVKTMKPVYVYTYTQRVEDHIRRTE